jgi:hypothetical protein
MEEIQNTKKPLSIVTVVVVLLIVGVAWSAMSRIFFRAKVKTLTNGIVDVKNGDQYQVKTKEGELIVSEEKGLAWPNNLPTNIPKYNDGKVKAVSQIQGQNTWSIVISETSEDYFSTYKELLSNDGWSDMSQLDLVVSMIQMNKGEYQIYIIWDQSSDGAVITLTKNIE